MGERSNTSDPPLSCDSTIPTRALWDEEPNSPCLGTTECTSFRAKQHREHGIRVGGAVIRWQRRLAKNVYQTCYFLTVTLQPFVSKMEKVAKLKSDEWNPACKSPIRVLVGEGSSSSCMRWCPKQETQATARDPK